MTRNFRTALLGAGALAALGGCAYQDPLSLPDLGPPARASQPYPGYHPYYGYGGYGGGFGGSYGYGSHSYGYGSGYRQGYDPYYYSGRYPGYYAPGVVYVPYPVPCVDANRDGRCDQRPPKKNDDNDGDGKHNDGKRPPRPRDDPPQGDGPRLRRAEGDRDIAPGMQPRVMPAPAPAVLRPVPVPPPQVQPAPRPDQVRPPAPPPRRVAPAPQGERGPRLGPGRQPAGDDPRRAQDP